jgi:hypothetical protein
VCRVCSAPDVMRAVVPILEAYFGRDAPHYERVRDTKVIIVPSVEDTAALPVYPQPPYARKMFATLPPAVLDNVLLMPNPCTFTVNGVVFGATSADALFHLSAESTMR